MKVRSFVFFPWDFVLLPLAAALLVFAAGWLVEDGLYEADCRREAAAILVITEQNLTEHRLQSVRTTAERLIELQQKADRLAQAMQTMPPTTEGFATLCRRLNISAACVRTQGNLAYGFHCRSNLLQESAAHAAVERHPVIATLAVNEGKNVLSATVARLDGPGHVTLYEDLAADAGHVLPRNLRGIFAEEAYVVIKDVIIDSPRPEWTGESAVIHPLISRIDSAPEGMLEALESGGWRWWQRRAEGARIVLFAPRHAGLSRLLPEAGAAGAVFVGLFVFLVMGRRRTSAKHRADLVALYTGDNAMSRLYDAVAIVTPATDDVEWVKKKADWAEFLSWDASASEMMAAIEENFVGPASRSAVRRFMNWDAIRSTLQSRKATDITLVDQQGERWVLYVVWAERDLMERATSFLLLLQKARHAVAKGGGA